METPFFPYIILKGIRKKNEWQNLCILKHVNNTEIFFFNLLPINSRRRLSNETVITCTDDAIFSCKFCL